MPGMGTVDAQSLAAGRMFAPGGAVDPALLSKAGGDVAGALAARWEGEGRLAAGGTAKVVGGIAAGSATGIALGQSAVVASLLSAAGVSSAVPYAGWIVGGALATAAGSIALVNAVRTGNARKAQAIELAASMGIPDAARVPGFIVKMLAIPSRERIARGRKLARRLKSARGDRRRKRLSAQLAVLSAVELFDRAQRRGTVPPAKAITPLRQQYGSANLPDEGFSIAPWVLLGLVGIGVTMLVRRRRR